MRRGKVFTDGGGGALELPVEELQAVVEDVLIGGVEAGLDAIAHHRRRPGRALQLQDLDRMDRTALFPSARFSKSNCSDGKIID